MPTYEEVAAEFLQSYVEDFDDREVEAFGESLHTAVQAAYLRGIEDSESGNPSSRDRLVSEVIWSGREREKLHHRLTEAVRARETAEAELERLRSVAREATGS